VSAASAKLLSSVLVLSLVPASSPVVYTPRPRLPVPALSALSSRYRPRPRVLALSPPPSRPRAFVGPCSCFDILRRVAARYNPNMLLCLCYSYPCSLERLRVPCNGFAFPVTASRSQRLRRTILDPFFVPRFSFLDSSSSISGALVFSLGSCLRPSDFVLRLSDFVLRPSDFVLRPSDFVLRPSALIPRPSVLDPCLPSSPRVRSGLAQFSFLPRPLSIFCALVFAFVLAFLPWRSILAPSASISSPHP